MAYLIMLTLDNADQLDDVLAAWREIDVDHVTYVECACSDATMPARPHVPMRFLLGGPGEGGSEPVVTAFSVVPGEDTVRRCIALAEAVVGDFDTAAHAMLLAWPVPILAGYPKRGTGEGQC